jgi:GNAT superfamily N-acetyltransferase
LGVSFRIAELPPDDAGLGTDVYSLLRELRPALTRAAPEARSGGVGAALFEELERLGRVAGCARVELDSGKGNQAAHRFYHRQRMGVIALHFAKELDQA